MVAFLFSILNPRLCDNIQIPLNQIRSSFASRESQNSYINKLLVFIALTGNTPFSMAKFGTIALKINASGKTL